MNRQDTLGIMAVIQAAYPEFYKGMRQEKAESIVGLWAEMLKDYPAVEVALAVKAFIATDTKGFPPKVGQIIDSLRKNRNRDEMTEMEAWGYVERATRRSAYYAEEEFAKLPPILQRIVGSPQQLKEWALMDADEVKTIVASNFQRSYRARAANEREFMALPSDVRNNLEAIGSGVKMPELPTGLRGRYE